MRRQAALNDADGGLLLDERAACARVVPAGELFTPPGTLVRHFTGPCPLSPSYDEPPVWGPTRKCRCFLSTFTDRTYSRLAARRVTSEAVRNE
jgi:hypothetical protein